VGLADCGLEGGPTWAVLSGVRGLPGSPMRSNEKSLRTYLVSAMRGAVAACDTLSDSPP
jgi:hypothetical protein